MPQESTLLSPAPHLPWPPAWALSTAGMPPLPPACSLVRPRPALGLGTCLGQHSAHGSFPPLHHPSLWFFVFFTPDSEVLLPFLIATPGEPHASLPLFTCLSAACLFRALVLSSHGVDTSILWLFSPHSKFCFPFVLLVSSHGLFDDHTTRTGSCSPGLWHPCASGWLPTLSLPTCSSLPCTVYLDMSCICPWPISPSKNVI